MNAKDLGRDFFPLVPEYEEGLKLAASGKLGGLDGQNYNTDYYSYDLKTDRSGQSEVAFNTLKVNEENLLKLQESLAKDDPIISKMANDLYNAKIYWTDVLGNDTEYNPDTDKEALKMGLAAKSIELARKANATTNVQTMVGDFKINKRTNLGGNSNSSKSGRNNGGNNGNGNGNDNDVLIMSVDDVDKNVKSIFETANQTNYTGQGEVQQEIDNIIANDRVLSSVSNLTISKGENGHTIATAGGEVKERFNEAGEVETYTENGKQFDLNTAGGYTNFLQYLYNKENPNPNKEQKAAIKLHLEEEERKFKLQDNKKQSAEKNKNEALALVDSDRYGADALYQNPSKFYEQGSPQGNIPVSMDLIGEVSFRSHGVKSKLLTPDGRGIANNQQDGRHRAELASGMKSWFGHIQESDVHGHKENMEGYYLPANILLNEETKVKFIGYKNSNRHSTDYAAGFIGSGIKDGKNGLYRENKGLYDFTLPKTYNNIAQDMVNALMQWDKWHSGRGDGPMNILRTTDQQEIDGRLLLPIDLAMDFGMTKDEYMGAYKSAETSKLTVEDVVKMINEFMQAVAGDTGGELLLLGH